MKHSHFKPQNISQGIQAVTGACNNVPAETRYNEETNLFAKKILRYIPETNDHLYILDYGAGIGRLAKEILKIKGFGITVFCLDNSSDMLKVAQQNLVEFGNKMTQFCLPEELNPPLVTEKQFDLCYLVYVLQHMPAVDIRSALERIHTFLKPDGVLFYCSADYRMAARYDNNNFYDDRFLGVNLQEELSRFFDFQEFAFTQTEIDSNPTVKRLVLGKWDKIEQLFDPGLFDAKLNPIWDWDETHPALIYRKKQIKGYLFNVKPLSDDDRKTQFLAGKPKNSPKNIQIELMKDKKPELMQKVKERTEKMQGLEILDKKDKESITEKLVLVNKLSPGDILVMTVAIRCLHKAYPGRFKTDVRSPAQEIFENSPYITKIDVPDKLAESRAIEQLKTDENHPPIKVGDVTFLIAHYPDIHQSGWSGLHFTDGHRRFLAKQLGIPIPRTGMRPDIFLSQTEKDWVNPFVVEFGEKKPYWAINAGSKGDYTLKQYPYYQEVVDLLKDKITFVQIGQKGHNHQPLKGIFDMTGKTPNLRQLFRLIYHSEGVISCVSLAHHIAGAFERSCVTVAGGREPMRWEMYPNQRYLYINGCCPAAKYDGCWRSQITDCPHLIKNVPMCMKMIRPEDIARSVELYYLGGVLKNDKIKPLI